MVIETVEAKLETVEQQPDNNATSVGQFSAYNAEVGQTDADPFTMANGKKVFDGAIANNCLKFGTQIEINEKIYTVSDRMNKRYGCENFDIFFWDKAEALKFGRRTLEYKIIN